MPPVVLVEDVGHVRVVTLNRPDKLNAFDADQFSGLAGALGTAADDPGVKVVVLTGAGRAFSSGADLSAFGPLPEPGAPDAPGRSADAASAFDTLQAIGERFPKPLVAAVNGIAVGLGFTILGYCDFVFVARNARLRTPFVDLGLVPEASSSYLFPLRMGWQRAARALLAGEWFGADDLVASGLALEVCDDDAVLERAVGYATTLAQGSLASMVATKALMLEAHAPHIAAARTREGEQMRALVGGPDNLAALAAFRDR